jgi:tRNA modification GTPase
MGTMSGHDTIVALGSGAIPAGIAVVRFSGPKCSEILEKFVKNPPKSREFRLRGVYDPLSLEIVDEGMVVFFPGPDSFTGEDCLELQLHGSGAVVKKILKLAIGFKGVRLAEPGEFARRAFENGRLDVLEVEGLGDLIEAQTEKQRVQALGRMKGGLSDRVDSWRSQLLSLSSLLEAQLDFSDEGDVGSIDRTELMASFSELAREMVDVAGTLDQGRIIREGFRVGLSGPPNVGKSSIINQLANSDIAIVTREAGTTRDVREVFVDIEGHLAIFLDSAGLRETKSEAERIGVQRARAMLDQCDLVLWVGAKDVASKESLPKTSTDVLKLANKLDLGRPQGYDLGVSCMTGEGFDDLRKAILSRITYSGADIFISRVRDQQALERGIGCLRRAATLLLEGVDPVPVELVAEEVRLARVELERLLGRIDSEQVLDELFSGFCIGK